MKLINNKIIKNAALFIAFVMVMASCQKLTRPALPSNYPVDANPPGGPLKFFAAYDATKNVDSIRANFGVNNSATIVPGGISGNCLAFTNNGYVSYPTANDFGNSTNFSFSFWLKIPLTGKDNNHAVGVMSLASSSSFWGNIMMYADNTTKGASDSMDLKCHFANGSGDNWDFAGYTGNARWPKMYDGNWHNVAFTYNASAKTGIFYRDGVVFSTKTNETIKFDGNVSELIVGGWEQADGIQGNYAGNTWMAGFAGNLDNVRLYGTTLSASDVAAIYANKN